MNAKISLNLLVLRSRYLPRAIEFYQALGLQFTPEQHGSGPVHYSADLGGLILEIYPLATDATPTTNTRLGFTVSALDEILATLDGMGVKTIAQPQPTPWGRRAIVQDWDGHKIELVGD